MIGYLRGHKVIWKEDKWYYEDNGLEFDDSRSCPQCHKMPVNGCDPCLGYIEGASGACCGHGVHVGYVNWEHISAPSGWLRGAYVGENYSE